MPYVGLLHPESLSLWQATADLYLCRRHSNTVLAQSLWGLWVWCLQGLFEPSECLWWVWCLILNAIFPLLPFCWGFSFALWCGVSFLVGSNILLLTVVQQWVIILKFSQDKISTCPSTPPSWISLPLPCKLLNFSCDQLEPQTTHSRKCISSTAKLTQDKPTTTHTVRT